MFFKRNGYTKYGNIWIREGQSPPRSRPDFSTNFGVTPIKFAWRIAIAVLIAIFLGIGAGVASLAAEGNLYPSQQEAAIHPGSHKEHHGGVHTTCLTSSKSHPSPAP